MRYARPATLAALILVAQSGCRTAGVDNLARQAPIAAKPQFDAHAIVAEHNRNAERIETIMAHPSIVVNRGLKNYAVDGNLALERPRNFRLEMKHSTGDVADIGSNDERFWFWVKDNQEKKVFYCNYDEAGNTPLPASTLQPDWIIEALGLRVITESEAAGLTITRGRVPDTLVLKHRPTRTGNDTVTRETVVSESTHRIKEHQLFAGEPPKLLAKAVVTEYMELSPVDRPDEQVYLPKRLRLDWYADKMALDVTFKATGTKINSDLSQKTTLFEQDERSGYEPYDLAAGFRPQQGQTTLRETLPAPPAGIELGEPAPIGIDGAMRTDRDPVALSAQRTSLRDDLVGPALPSAPGPDFAKPAVTSRWRASSTREQ